MVTTKRRSAIDRHWLVLWASLSLLGGTALQGCSSEGGGSGGSTTTSSTTSAGGGSTTTSTTSASGGPTCGTGQVLCGDACADLQSDAANCGACGTACAAGEVCSQGSCALQCAGGATKCGASCVELAVDPANCGACGNACPADQYCSGGACAATCSGTLCGSQCVDVSTNAAHCGSCDTACSVSQICQGGSCACPAGASACGNDCVDLSSNSLSCGACGAACGDGQVCSGGVCLTPTAGNGGFTKTPLTGSAMPKVAIYAAASATYGPALQMALQGTGQFSQVDFVNVTAGTGTLPTVAQMQAYDAVAVFTQAQPQAGLGDNLATYFESGGGVLLFDWEAQFNSTPALVGRFEAQYTLSTQTISSTSNVPHTTVTLGTILEPASPLMTGVFTFGYQGSSPHHLPASSFTVSANNPVVVAQYLEDGNPAVVRGITSAPVAAGRHLVEINGFGAPAATSGIISVGWDPTSDGAVLIANALAYTLPAPSVGMAASLSFGSQALYTPSASQAVTYTNVSSVPQTITAVSLTGTQISDFAIVPSSALPVTLPPGGTFVVNVTFDPSDTGLRAAMLHAVVQGVGVDATTLFTGSGM